MSYEKKILCVSSCGGHFAQILRLTDAIPEEHKVYVLNDKTAPVLTGKKIFYITHAERGLGQIINFFEALRIVASVRPVAILSTGASPAVIFALVAKLFRVDVIYVESFSRVVSLSLTGKLMRFLATRFYVQWPDLKKIDDKFEYLGGIL